MSVDCFNHQNKYVRCCRKCAVEEGEHKGRKKLLQKILDDYAATRNWSIRDVIVDLEMRLNREGD